MAASYTSYYNSPLGQLQVTGTNQSITSVLFVEEAERVEPDQGAILPERIKSCLQQLDEYFAGVRQEFDLPLLPTGTPFQQQVWEHLKTVPFGKTASYLDVARAVSGERAIRAVGGANGRNPISIIIPCHRIISSDGSLTGYAGKLWRKEWLLRHEGVLKPDTQLSFF